jgi:hypothetical protein
MQDAKHNWVGCLVTKVRRMKVGVTGLLVGLIVGVSSLASAQSPINIPVDIPSYDYAGVATTLLGLMAFPVAAAIGLGLSFFGIRFIYRLFKSMAR